MEGFIYLHRKMLDWEWYDDINTCRVFLHCLFRANWKPCKWHGVDIEPGQFITSLQNLAVETGLSVRQIRTALDHLISTGEVTSKSQSKFRIITVNNWDRYQASDKQVDKQPTSKRQGSDKVATTDEESNKEIKKINNIFVVPTVDEVRAYCNERKNGIDPETFINFYSSKGWMIGKNKMKDWKAAVRTWEKSEKERGSKGSKFNNFDSRKYNFDELESEVYG